MILIIQTVRPEIELIILDDKLHAVAGRNWASAKDEVSRVLPEMEKLMETAEIGWKDVKKIVVFNGTGGFASTRIGVTIANTLAMASQAELFELSWPEDQLDADTAKLVKDFLTGADGYNGTAQAVKIATPKYKAEPMISTSKQKNFN